MGGTQSTEHGQYGFHVLRVKENSPAHLANIEPLFDFIVGVNNDSLENDDGQVLLNALKEHEGKELDLAIYSSKEQRVRSVKITPSKEWHSDAEEKSLIGCSIRYCSYEHAGEHVWHILDVAPDSPAEMAGIIPHTDYVIGSSQTVFSEESDFFKLVESSLGRRLHLYVYNTEWGSCREVIITPNHDWGGDGSLGCDVGYGLLHKIPKREPELALEDAAMYSTTIFNEEETDRPVEEDNATPEQVLQEARNTKLPESPNSAEKSA